MDDSSFLSLLTQETFNNLKDDDFLKHSELSETEFKINTNPSFDHFDNLLALSKGVKYLSGQHCIKTRTYKFNINGFQVDFPENWKIFKSNGFNLFGKINNKTELEFTSILKLILNCQKDEFIYFKKGSSIVLIGNDNLESCKFESIYYFLELMQIETNVEKNKKAA